MNLLVELLYTIFQCLWLWLVAIYKAVVPVQYQHHKDVQDQIVVVTGAGSGLGRALSLRFAALGCKVILWDINTQAIQETEKMIKAAGGTCGLYTVDVSSREKIYEAGNKVKTDWGPVDILVNNAGIVTGKKFLECPDALMEKTMQVNCNAHFWTTKTFLTDMLSRDSGHIVSLASSAGLFGVSGLADYCASKFGAVGFDESLRYELVKMGKTGINTTVVCPFFINTGMFQGIKFKFPHILPMLDQEYVVDKVMHAVLTNQTMLLLPRVLYIFYIVKGILPCTVQQSVVSFFGVSDHMDDFIGRAKSQ